MPLHITIPHLPHFISQPSTPLPSPEEANFPFLFTSAYSQLTSISRTVIEKMLLDVEVNNQLVMTVLGIFLTCTVKN